MPRKKEVVKPYRIQGHPAKLLREAGYEPFVIDATEPLEFEVRDDPKWLKGLTLGDESNCPASKACTDLPEVAKAFIVRKYAYVVFNDGRQVRYEHNGLIPKAFDHNIMTPAGIYSLKPVVPSHRGGNGTGHIKTSKDGSDPRAPRPNGPRGNAKPTEGRASRYIR